MVKLSIIDRKLMTKISNSKARGMQIFIFSAVQSNSFERLCSAGMAEDINGFAYLTDKGIKKVKKL